MVTDAVTISSKAALISSLGGGTTYSAVDLLNSFLEAKANAVEASASSDATDSTDSSSSTDSTSTTEASDASTTSAASYESTVVSSLLSGISTYA